MNTGMVRYALQRLLCVRKEIKELKKKLKMKYNFEITSLKVAMWELKQRLVAKKKNDGKYDKK